MSKQCPNCGTPNADSAMYCSNCQAPLQFPSPKGDNTSNILKIIIIVLLSILVLGGAIVATYFIARSGSKDEVTVTETIKVADQTSATPAAAPAAAPAAPKAEPVAAPVVDPNHYVGAIGKYGVECYIYVNGSSVSGKYRYTRMKGKGGWLDLVGSASGNHVELYEYNNNGEQTGYWDGYMNNGKYSGDFWNYKGTHYNFSLKNQ